MRIPVGGCTLHGHYTSSCSMCGYRWKDLTDEEVDILRDYVSWFKRLNGMTPAEWSASVLGL